HRRTRPPNSNRLPYTTLFRSRPGKTEVRRNSDTRTDTRLGKLARTGTAANRDIDRIRWDNTHQGSTANVKVAFRITVVFLVLGRPEDHTHELQSRDNLMCSRL